tara:strand:- start:283 stop:606 length:324 start_codon:yes stop_codon:yes gene_type:complete
VERGSFIIVLGPSSNNNLSAPCSDKVAREKGSARQSLYLRLNVANLVLEGPLLVTEDFPMPGYDPGPAEVPSVTPRKFPFELLDNLLIRLNLGALLYPSGAPVKERV